MTPGFADPVADAQRTFRAVLNGLARPGTVHHVAPAAARPLPPAAAAVCLTLLDADTTCSCADDLAGAWPWLAFHTAARAAPIGRAAFVLTGTLPDLASLHPGTDAVPEAGATLILCVPALDGGPPLTLRGPGIDGTATLAAPLGPDFAAHWAAAQYYPLGIDLILCAGDRLAALPRTTRVA